MKTILLSIDAKYIHTNNAVRLLKANTTFDVDIVEFTIKDSVQTMLQTIHSMKPDIIGFSVYIWNVEIVKQILHHESFPDCIVILGGPEVSYDASHFLALPHVKYVVKGEGELTFHKLLETIHNSSAPYAISGLAYIENGQLHETPISEISDLSSIQMPYYFDEDKPHYKHKITYIESSRGCPYHCSYCLSSLEQKVRFFPVDTVISSIQYAMEQGTKTIKFLDRTFNANRHTMTILENIIALDNQKTTFQFEITGDILDPSIIDYIHENARKGLFRFEIGIQSTNDQTNRLVDRLQNTQKLFDRIKQIQQYDIIDLHLDLIAGLPMEDKDSFIKTFNDVFLLGAKELQLGFLKMLRGTKIRLQDALYEYEYDSNAPYEIIRNNVLSSTDINEIKQVEHMLEIYHNKGYFGTNLHAYILSQSSPYHFFLSLAKHYETNHYDVHRYQLEDVYRHLFELVDEDIQFQLIEDYLTRSRIKPKLFFKTSISKDIRSDIYQTLSTTENIPLHLLYKHSILVVHKDMFLCVYYRENAAQLYKGKAPI